MIRLTKEKILYLYQLMTEQTGGSPGLRDEGLLESSIECIYQTFAGEELYKTKEEKGARLGFSIISNHPFVDGNKRIGMYAMLTFLEVNGIHLDITDNDIVEAGMGVASGKMSYESLLQWVISHRTTESV